MSAATADLGEFAEDFTSLKWRYEERRDGEIARFTAAGYALLVVDCDGDSSYWTLKHHRMVVAEGESASHVPNHFFVCLQAAEEALRSAVAARLAVMREADGNKPS